MAGNPIAAVLTSAVLAAGVVPPTEGPVMRTVGMTGDASIPVFLVGLGLQPADMHPVSAVRRTFPMVGVTVLVAPVVTGLIVLLRTGALG